MVGAGLAGLSAAVALSKAGRQVTVYEAAGHAGGRCRSYDDEALGRRIDNGNHLVLSGNESVQGYLRDIGAADALTGPGEAAFPFIDVRTGERWRVAIGEGRLPWWMFSAARRPPGTSAIDMLKGLSLLRAGDRETVAGCLAGSRAYEGFWEPLALAVLNTEPVEGSASLLGAVLRETVVRGGSACRPLIARTGLGDAFVEPALALLANHGIEVQFAARLRELELEGSDIRGLRFSDRDVPLDSGDTVILAVPAWVAESLVHGLDVPTTHRAIVNAHYLLSEPCDDVSFLGLVGGVAQWLFVRGDVASVTVSAADDLADEDASHIAEKIWPEVAQALDIKIQSLPRYRIIKEKRATFAQTPAEVRCRPVAATTWRNLWLAGDWIDTGLPATIEGALKSGRQAAGLAMSNGNNP